MHTGQAYARLHTYTYNAGVNFIPPVRDYEFGYSSSLDKNIRQVYNFKEFLLFSRIWNTEKKHSCVERLQRLLYPIKVVFNPSTGF
jgi:hypothetical protein